MASGVAVPNSPWSLGPLVPWSFSVQTKSNLTVTKGARLADWTWR